MTIFMDKSRRYPFCPGCTHGVILDAVRRALEGINADPARTVLISDIGCIGMADRYFSVHTFHGLHGRSFTYAAGIKMANPGLKVFVLVGDGGCGIGGHHLINAARRNVGITVICCNNFNYGMTGGEQSVTTPLGGRTHTTPGGSIERPFDLCKLVMSAGGSFVARKTAFDADLDDVIGSAMTHDGFAFIDIVGLCTAYYGAMNQFGKKDIADYLAKNSMQTGILADTKFPEYSMALRTLAVTKPLSSPSVPPHDFKPLFEGEGCEILISGSAGMRIISAASYLARAGIAAGLFASERDDYPVTVRSGHSLSVVKLSKERINYLGVSKPDAVVCVSAEGLEKVGRIIEGLGRDSTVVLHDGIGDVKTSAQVVRIAVGGASAVISAISALLTARNIIDPGAFRAVLASIPSEKIRNENLEAFTAGRNAWQS